MHQRNGIFFSLAFKPVSFLERKEMGLAPVREDKKLFLRRKVFTRPGIRRALFEPGIDAVTVIQRQIEVVAVSDIVHTKMLTILTFAKYHCVTSFPINLY